MKSIYIPALIFLILNEISFAQVSSSEKITRKRDSAIELQNDKAVNQFFKLSANRGPITIDTFGNLQACDTVFYSWYYFTNDGAEAYISGHNDNLDSAKAEKYIGLSGSQINALWMFFGVATYTDPNLQVIHVNVWDDSGPGGLPGNILGTTNITHAAIKADVDAGNLTTVTFPTPIAMPASGNIYCGFTMDYKKKNGKLVYDTTRAVNLLNPDFFSDCNTQEENTAWELYSKTYGQGGQWHDYVYSWGYGNRNPIFPIIQTNSCEITIAPGLPEICNGSSINISASGATTYTWSPSTGLNTTEGADVIASPSVTTTYTVSGDTDACSKNVTVIVNPTPVISLGVDTVVCDTSNFSLNAGEGYNSYLWSTNETSQKITVTESGEYFVTVKDVNGCQGSDTINVTVDICAAIESIQNFSVLTIYPNPANENFILSVKNSEVPYVKIEIENTLGEILFTSNNDSFSKASEQLINVSRFPSSIYLVKVFLGNETITKKLIIQK